MRPCPGGEGSAEPIQGWPKAAWKVWATAPITAVSVEASGAFNPLHKVLCILRSHYFWAIGTRFVDFLAMDTSGDSNCSSKPLYSGIPPGHATAGQGTRCSAEGTVALDGGPFQSRFRCLSHHSTNRKVHCPQHLLESRIADQITRVLLDWPDWWPRGFRDSRSGRDCSSLVHSPLLQQSRLLAFPPLNDMLKLSGLLPGPPVTDQKVVIA